jgi:hypothetical protein
VHPADLLFEVRIANLAAAGFAVGVLVVGRWGDRSTQLGELGADRLDTPPQTIRTITMALMLGDVAGD